MTHIPTRPHTSAVDDDLGEQLLRAIDGACWDDGTRLVDVDPAILRQRLLPPVLTALRTHHRLQPDRRRARSPLRPVPFPALELVSRCGRPGGRPTGASTGRQQETL